MNYGKYADGGVIAPTPYVPNLSQHATQKAQSLTRTNANGKLEALMQEQTQTKVAERMGISQVQVSRMEKRILKTMRERLEGG